MKKLFLIILPILFFCFLLVDSSLAAPTDPPPPPSPTDLISKPTTPKLNPAPPIGTTCGNTVCLKTETCMQFPGDADQHCVPNGFIESEFDPNWGPDIPPECAEKLGKNNGVFPPNSTCWNAFKNAQTQLNLYKKTCIYEPVVQYSATRYLRGPDEKQPYEMCGIGECGPDCPVSTPGGGDFDCTVAMLVYTDVRDAELGGYGPSDEALDSLPTDFIAQNYLYNSLFDRPMDLSDKSREAYRTYWRLLPANNQANLRSFVLNMAHDDLMLNINFDYTDSNGSKKKTEFKKLFDDLSKQIILFTHFPFTRIGCLTSYPVCPEYSQAMSSLSDDLSQAYSAFVPLDFSSTRGYIVKRKDELEEQLYAKYDRWLRDTFNAPRYGTDKPKLTNISRENLPYIGAIYQGLLSPKFGMFPALQPQWIIDKYATSSGISDYKMGNLPSDLPEVKIAKRNFLEALKEEAEAILTNPISWVSSRLRSFFTDEDQLKGYTKNDEDNKNDAIRQAYVNMKGCPLPVSYHLISPKTVAKSLDDHHQVISIPGDQLSWSYTPEITPLIPKFVCRWTGRGTGNPVETCDWETPICPLDDEHYQIGETCYRRKWSVDGIKHGKALTVLNNPKQTDIKNTVIDNDKYSFFKMMLPAGASKISDASIDAPIAKNFVSDNGAATGPNGTSVMLNPAEPINRVNNRAQDSMHILQNCWVVPKDQQNSPRCDFVMPQNATSSACGAAPVLPTNPACTVKGNSLNLPETLISTIEAAGSTFKVPPALLIAIMYGEGAFNPGSPYFDDSFIKENLPACSTLPDCNPDGDVIDNIVPFFSGNWDNLKDAVKKFDPQREPNACNLMDGIFALAQDLSQNQYGSAAFAGKTCLGIPLNAGTGGSSSCTWSPSSVETAIRVWEFGTAYNDNLSCATKENSCLLGGGLAAQCPTGGDTCPENPSLPSHNGCVMSVYKAN